MAAEPKRGESRIEPAARPSRGDFAPIARITVSADGKVLSCTLYAPGLPEGGFDLFPAAGARMLSYAQAQRVAAAIDDRDGGHDAIVSFVWSLAGRTGP